MKITYTADDGTEFNSPDECLAYENDSHEQFLKWEQCFIAKGSEPHNQLWEFWGKWHLGLIEFETLKDVWTYRKRFVELAKSFAEADQKDEES